jgi:hypothetical protein
MKLEEFSLGPQGLFFTPLISCFILQQKNRFLETEFFALKNNFGF